jgi:hypothetical protein
MSEEHYHKQTIGHGPSQRTYYTVVLPNWVDEHEWLVVHETHDSRGHVVHWQEHSLLPSTDVSGSHLAYVRSREAPPLDQPDE